MWIVSLVTVFVVALVVLNFCATVKLWRSESYTLGQKIAQSLIIWLIPVLGTSLVLFLMRQESWHTEAHYEQLEQTDRYNLDGDSVPWSGPHNTTL